MFRILKDRVGSLSLSPLPLRVLSATRQDGIAVQRVRFLRPRRRARAIVGTMLSYVVLYAIFERVVTTPLQEIAEDLEEVEVDEQRASIFIPLPGTTKTIQPPPYRGRDPEWQEYVKYTKDSVLDKKVKDDLATFIQKVLEKQPAVIAKCGKDIKLGRYWLDTDFPISPFPEYERSGIEILDDSIRWRSMPVDSLTANRIRQALWPSAFTQSLWSFSKALLWNDASAVGSILGGSPKTQPSVGTTAPESTTPTSAKSAKPKPLEGNAPPNSTVGRASESSHANQPSAKALTKILGERVERLNKDLIGLSEETKGVQQLQNETPIWKRNIGPAITAFQTKLKQTWRPAPNYPPRGSIIISGLIEFDTARARMVVDVRAAWDPKTKQYDVRSMQVELRGLRLKRQAPRGE